MSVDDARALAGDGHVARSVSFNEMFMLVAGAFSNARARRHGRAYVLSVRHAMHRGKRYQVTAASTSRGRGGAALPPRPR